MADKPNMPDTVKHKLEWIVANLLPRIHNKFVFAITGETASGKILWLCLPIINKE